MQCKLPRWTPLALLRVSIAMADYPSGTRLCVSSLCSYYNCSCYCRNKYYSVCLSVCVRVCVCVRRRMPENRIPKRCLRKIAGIKWQDRTTNVEVLQTCKIAGMEALLLQAHSDGPGILYECQIIASRSRYSTGNWNRERDCQAGPSDGTRTLSRLTSSGVESTRTC